MQQQIEVGDTVQLTASVVFTLNRDQPEILQKMMVDERSGGQVVEVTPEAVVIDIGQDQPLTLEVSDEGRDIALQVVRKGAAAKPPAPAAAPAPQPVPAGGSPTPLVTTVQPVNPSQIIPQLLGLNVPPEGATPFMQVFRGPQFDRQEPPLPQQVRLAQWVMNQFIGLKQYGIVQDLNRTMDADAPRHEQNAFDKKDVRAVAVELSATEESLYNTALNKIGKWIGGTDQSTTPRQVHPEMETDDAIPTTLPPCGESPAEPLSDHPEGE